MNRIGLCPGHRVQLAVRLNRYVTVALLLALPLMSTLVGVSRAESNLNATRLLKRVYAHVLCYTDGVCGGALEVEVRTPERVRAGFELFLRNHKELDVNPGQEGNAQSQEGAVMGAAAMLGYRIPLGDGKSALGRTGLNVSGYASLIPDANWSFFNTNELPGGIVVEGFLVRASRLATCRTTVELTSPLATSILSVPAELSLTVGCAARWIRDAGTIRWSSSSSPYGEIPVDYSSRPQFSHAIGMDAELPGEGLGGGVVYGDMGLFGSVRFKDVTVMFGSPTDTDLPGVQVALRIPL